MTHLPAAVFGLHSNPRYFDSGLTTHSRNGRLLGIPVIDPNAGTTTQSLGRLSAEDWLHGAVPWWNPYAGVGLPLAAEMQSGSFFLPFVLLLHFDDGVTYLRIAMQILAGLATMAFLLQLRMTYTASFLGGLLYALNGTFAWFAHAQIMPLAFLPLLLLGIERAIQSTKANQRGGWTWITIAIAYAIYAGFPEVAFMNGLLALLWAVVRLFQLVPNARLGFVLKVTGGGTAGILLAAPLLVPFFEYLQHSAVSHNDFSRAGLPASSLLQLMLPYVYGPINAFPNIDPANELWNIWGNIGGYFGISVIFLAVLACLQYRDHRALKIVLLLWTVLLVARMVGVSGTDALLRLIPGINYVAVYRNSSGSVEMAVIILAAFAIDSWRRNSVATRTPVFAALAVTSLLLGAAYLLGLPLISRLLSAHSYRRSLHESLIFAASILVASAAICARAPNQRRAILLGAVIACEAMVLYGIPTLSGLRDVTEDTTPISFIKQHVGLQRAYSLGTVHPNYGSFYQIPFINHESLPVSDTWVRYIKSTLDPGIDPVTFSGDYPGPFSERQDEMSRHLAGMQRTGIKYVLVPRDAKPFWLRTAVPHPPGGNYAVPLNAGQQISGTLPKITAAAGLVENAAILIGTNTGKASGPLSLELCNRERCSTATSMLEGAKDNAPLDFDLDTPLMVDAGAALRYTLKHPSGAPLAVWVFPRPGAEATPDVGLFSAPGEQPRRVFRNTNSDIFELPQASAYFSAAHGACSLQVKSRTVLQATCSVPDTLLRRELAYPGWTAAVNGRNLATGTSEIFQTVELPKGKSEIEFRYRPRYLTRTLIAALLGLAVLISRFF